MINTFSFYYSKLCHFFPCKENLPFLTPNITIAISKE